MSMIIGERVRRMPTMDRMSSARFETPEATLEGRKNLILRIEEVDGRATAEFTEK